MLPFSQSGPTVRIDVAATSTPTSIGAISPEALTCELYNAGTALCYVAFGFGAAPTATVQSYPVGPGHCKVVSLGRVDTAAAICPGGTTTLLLTPGHGM